MVVLHQTAGFVGVKIKKAAAVHKLSTLTLIE